jgi:hypothetical protein
MRFSWLLLLCFTLPRGYYNILSPVNFDKFYTAPLEQIGKDNPARDEYLKRMLGILQNEEISIIERTRIANEILESIEAD